MEVPQEDTFGASKGPAVGKVQLPRGGQARDKDKRGRVEVTRCPPSFDRVTTMGVQTYLALLLWGNLMNLPPSSVEVVPQLRMTAGTEFLGRDLSYSDDVAGVLRPYALGVGSSLFAEVELQPIKPAGPLFLAVEARLAVALGLGSADPEGNQLETRALRTQVELRAGTLVGIFGIEGQIALGFDSFNIEDTQDVPDANYLYARMGLGSRLRLGPAHMHLSLGYRPILSAGELTSEAWFPRAFVGGVDLHLTVELELYENFGILASGSGTRYFADFAVEAGATRRVGGFVDQRWGAGLGLSYRL